MRTKLAALAFWLIVWQLAAMALGHGGLFLATPGQTLGALAALLPTAGFWRRVLFTAGRILLGFVLAVLTGVALGALSSRWRAARALVEPVMQLIRAMPVASFVILALLWVRSANLSVVVSFTHVLPVIYEGTLTGIADTDRQLLEMAKVYRLPLSKTLRVIWLPGCSRRCRKAASPPWACAGKAAFRRRSSACRTGRWETRFTGPKLPLPRRRCSRGRWSS